MTRRAPHEFSSTRVCMGAITPTSGLNDYLGSLAMLGFAEG
jgi:hypothetical protein